MGFFDPRKVELRFKGLAYVVVGTVLLTLFAYAFFSVYKILSGVQHVQRGVDDDWGTLPDLSLCSFVGQDVRFAFIDTYTSHGDSRFGLKNLDHPEDPLNIWAEVSNTTTWPGLTTQCLRLKTSSWVPDLDANSSDYVELAVSFESQLRYKGVRGSVGVPTSFVLDAFEDGLSALPKYAGTLGYPAPALVSGPRSVSVMELHKMVSRRQEVRSSFYEATQKEERLEGAGPPLRKLRVASGAEGSVSNVTDPSDPRLHVVHFAISLHSTWGMSPQVPVYRWVTRKEQIVTFIGSLGGLLSVATIVLSICFPRKYPYSSVAATYDLQTLLFHQSEETDVAVDTHAEKFKHLCPRKSNTETACFPSMQESSEDDNGDCCDEEDVEGYRAPNFSDLQAWAKRSLTV
mmetsp:Transcript_7857/g.23281  ORF Transcript_7857/g.23281 Transcript_7857/m.23281 type:complete len:402 (-) Transcript_7857:298-1503(-)